MRTRSRKEEREYRRNEHNKSCCILVSQTVKKLGLELSIGSALEVFRLAFACAGGYEPQECHQIFSDWIEDPHRNLLHEVVENFCINVLADRVVPLTGHQKARRRTA